MTKKKDFYCCNRYQQVAAKLNEDRSFSPWSYNFLSVFLCYVGRRRMRPLSVVYSRPATRGHTSLYSTVHYTSDGYEENHPA